MEAPREVGSQSFSVLGRTPERSAALDERVGGRKDEVVMRTLPLVCLAALALLTPARSASLDARVAQAVDERKPEDVAERLKAAFESGGSAEQIAALQESAYFPHPKVVAQAQRGLASRDVEVRLAAMDALGRNAHAAAFEALLAHYQSQRKALRSMERDLPALLSAVARRGDARARAVLTDDVQAQLLAPTIRARLLGLARIRSKESIDDLMTLADTVGFIGMHNHLEDFRLALVVLSGVDHGRSLDAWRAWWRGVKDGYTPPPKAPELNAADATRWREFWREAPPRGDEVGR